MQSVFLPVKGQHEKAIPERILRIRCNGDGMERMERPNTGSAEATLSRWTLAWTRSWRPDTKLELLKAEGSMAGKVPVGYGREMIPFV